MLIAMFGATGVVGSAMLGLALDRGHDVRVLTRSLERLPARRSGDPDVVVGDALDPVAVAKTVAGCDAVMSALGGFGDGEAIDNGTANIMAAMRESGVRRLIVMQGFHIPWPGDPRNRGARLVDALLRARSPRLVAGSHALGGMLQDCTDLDWTLVRAPMVKRAPATGRTQQGTLTLGPGSRVTTGDLADVLLATLSDPTTVRTAPMVCSA